MAFYYTIIHFQKGFFFKFCVILSAVVKIMAVCSQIHTKHINTACWQNVKLLNVKLAVHIVTTWL